MQLALSHSNLPSLVVVDISPIKSQETESKSTSEFMHNITSMEHIQSGSLAEAKTALSKTILVRIM